MAEYTPDEFAAVLMGVVAKTPKETVQVVRKGAGNVKDGARRNVAISAPIHNAHAARTINFDVEARGTEVIAEIGYDRSVAKAANISWVLEYGGGGDHSPPHRDVGRALDDEEPRFEQALGDMGERLLD